MSRAEADRLRAGLAALSAGDLEAVGRMLHPRVRWRGSEPRFDCRSRRQALAWMSRPEARRPRRILDVLDAGAGRYIVVVQPTPGADDEPGADPPERAVLLTLRDGLVVEIQGHDTVEGACAAAGIDSPASRP